jgi:PAS domain S-box-containing protein
MGLLDDGSLSQWLTLFGQNIAMGFVVVAIFATVWTALESRWLRFEPVVVGALFGCAGIVSMLSPVNISAGIILDMRNVFVLVGGLFGGPLGALIAAVLTGLYRIYHGGTGTVSGIGSIATAALIGGLIARHYGRRIRDFGVIHLAVVGLITALATIAWTRIYFTVKGIPPVPVAAEVAVLLIYPAATGLLGIAMSMTHYRTWRLSHRRLSDILETASDLVWEIDTIGRFTYASTRYAEMLGFSLDEILGRSGESMGGRWIDEATEQKYAAAFVAHKPFDDLHYLPPTRDGTRKILAVTGRPTIDERGRFFGYRGTATDITEREKLRNLVTTVSGQVGNVVGEDFLKKLVDSVAQVLDADIAHVGRFDLTAGTVRELYISAKDRFLSQTMFAYRDLPSGVIAGGQSLMVSSRLFERYPRLAEIARVKIDAYAAAPLLSAKGEVFGILSVMCKRPFESPEYVEAILNLFAGRAAAELERIIREEEATLGRRRMTEVLAALDIERDAIIIADGQGLITYANRSAAELIGLARAEESVIGRRFGEFWSDQSFAETARAALSGTGEWQGSGPWIRPIDGKSIVFDARARVLPNGGTVIVVTDATERHRLLAEEHRHHQSLERAQRVGKIGSIEANLVNGTSVWSDELFNILGLDPKITAPGFDRFLECVHPDDRERFRLLRQNTIAGGVNEPTEFRIVRPDGEVRWIFRQGETIRDDQGKPRSLIATLLDVTERKHLEERLRHSHDGLVHAQRLGKIGSSEVDLVTGEVIWSDEQYRLFGIDPAQGSASLALFLSMVHPEDRARMAAIRQRNAQGIETEPTEFRILLPGGEMRWIHREVGVQRDPEGKPVKFFTTQQDITERKRLEEELRRSHEGLVHAQRMGRIGSAEVDLRTGITLWSDEQRRIYGIEEGATPVTFEDYLNYVHPSDREMLRALRALNREGAGMEPVEYRIIRTDGEERWVHREVELRRDAHGTPITLFTTQQDVTERKRLEAELRRSHDRLVHAQRIGRIGSSEVDLRADRAIWSAELCSIYGVDSNGPPPTREAFLAMVHPDDREAVRATRARNNDGKGLDPIEFRIVRPDGGVRWIHREVELRRDTDGTPAILFTTQQDITDRRRMEEELRRGREHLARAQLTAGIGSAEVNLETGEETWSEELYRISGLDPATTRPHYTSLIPLVHPDDRDAWEETITASRRGLATEPIDVRIVRPDGQVRWVHREGAPLLAPDGSARAVVATYQDVTERKNLENELAARQENLQRSARHLANAQRVGRMASVEIDLATGQTEWSTATFDLFGIASQDDQPKGEQFMSLVHPDDRQKLRELRARELKGIETEPTEYRYLRPDGELRWMYRQTDLVRDAEGKPTKLIVTHQDLTDREKWRRVLETLSGNVGNLIGQDFLRSLVANVAQALRADVVYIGWFEVDSGMVRTQYVHMDGALIENCTFPYRGAPSGKIAEGQTVILADNAQRQFPTNPNPFSGDMDAYAGTPLYGSKGNLLGLLVAMSRRPWEAPDYVETVLNLFARRAAAEIERVAIEEEAKSSRNQMAEILAALNIARSAVVLSDEDRRLVYTNEVATDLLGLPSEPGALAGKRLADFQADNKEFLAIAVPTVAALEESDHWEGSFPWRRPADGKTLFLDALIHRLPNRGFVLVAIDATARIKLEQEERRHQERQAQASKLEALGNLAGGIAHDFNNLLGAVLGFGQFLMQDLEPGSDQHRFAERIVGVSQRGRSLVQQILTFSRRSVIEPTHIRLRDGIAETYELLRATLPASTQIVIDNRAKEAIVLADRGQLVQVLVNLCANGSDALDGEPGTVTVSVAELDPTRSDLARLPPAEGKPTSTAVESWRDADGMGHIVTGAIPRGNCVSLAVTDSGTGISDAMLGQIFEPFITTKEKGRGTGLGLAVVHRIVSEHGGAILVTTRHNGGTKFEILLPLSGEAAEAQHDLSDGGTQSVGSDDAATILVVDDDEAYCAMVQTALRRVGYHVESTNDPRMALGWVRHGTQKWDILVTDQTMPHIKGRDLVRSFKALSPATRCIICTGFSSGLNEQQALAAGADGFMLKPFNVGDLAMMVARLVSH